MTGEQATPGAHRHEHGGHSTKGLINPGKLLAKIGVKEGDYVLDLGCGDGYISMEAAMKFVGIAGRVHGVDVDAKTISSLNAIVEQLGLQNVDATIADATKSLPVPDASIDTCIIANVLHGFAVNKEVDLVFTELRRVMKSGGKIAIVEFKKKRHLTGPPFEDRLSPADVDELLATHGCSKVAAFNAGVLHYARVFMIG